MYPALMDLYFWKKWVSSVVPLATAEQCVMVELDGFSLKQLFYAVPALTAPYIDATGIVLGDDSIYVTLHYWN